jgi:hypothetical protein
VVINRRKSFCFSSLRLLLLLTFPASFTAKAAVSILTAYHDQLPYLSSPNAIRQDLLDLAPSKRDNRGTRILWNASGLPVCAKSLPAGISCHAPIKRDALALRTYTFNIATGRLPQLDSASEQCCCAKRPAAERRFASGYAGRARPQYRRR